MYGEIYYHDYNINDVDKPARLSILKKDYIGESQFVDAGETPFVKGLMNNEEDVLGGISPTMASIKLIGDASFGMEDIYTASDSEFQIIHYIDGLVDWIGFLIPESFGENDTNGIRYLELNASDGLTKLKDIKFIDSSGVNYGTVDGNYSKSLMFSVKECLKKTGLSLNIKTLVDRIPVILNEVYTKYLIAGFSNGFAYSSGFNGLSEELLKPGNYISYKYEDIEGYYTASILDVDRSQVSEDGGVGIKLSSPISGSTSIPIEAFFFEANLNYLGDVLNDIDHDVRVWINPEASVNRKQKKDQTKKYYEFTDGTLSAWHVLNNIALAFDCVVSQNKGYWYFMSLDNHRVNDGYFEYDSEGVMIEKTPKDADQVLPIEESDISYRADGNTRYIDKTLKRVAVQYQYRYKTDGDDLANIFVNEGKFLPDGNFPEATFTPLGWERFSIAKPITFNVFKPNLGDFLEFNSPDEFNEFNGIKSGGYKVREGDKIKLSWEQRINELDSNFRYASYVTSQIILLGESGETYYLVNDREEEGWTDHVYMSPNPWGKWRAKVKDDRIFHFNTNYATSHNPTTSGALTPWSKVTIHMEDLPESGILEVRMVGCAHRIYVSSSASKSAANAWSYILDYDEFFSTGKVTYIEDTRFIPGDVNKTEYIKWFKNDFNTYCRVRNIELLKETTSQRSGSGRLYEYIQEGEYFDAIDDINILIGDEENTDHLSMLRYEGKTIDKWISKDGSLHVGTLGLLLAKSIMRRYYMPKKLIDGVFSTYPIELLGNTVFDDDPNYKWFVKGGEISSKSHHFEGTICQYLNVELPIGGVDYGPNSVNNSSSSGTGSTSGASQSWVSAQGYVKADDSTLDKTLQRGNTSALPIMVKGVRNSKFLELPKIPVSTEDSVAGENYLHADNGYLLVNNSKVKAGIADSAENSAKWEGKTVLEMFDQEVKKASNVEFNSVKTNSITIGSDVGLNIVKKVKLFDDSIEQWTFKSGVLVKVEVV